MNLRNGGIFLPNVLQVRCTLQPKTQLKSIQPYFVISRVAIEKENFCFSRDLKTSEAQKCWLMLVLMYFCLLHLNPSPSVSCNELFTIIYQSRYENLSKPFYRMKFSRCCHILIAQEINIICSDLAQRDDRDSYNVSLRLILT